MKLTINDIIDKYKNHKCIVIGHGPSLNEYLPHLQEIKDAGYILIGCNNWNEFYPNVIPHYWVSANNVDNSTNLMHLINKYKSTWIYSDSIDLTNQTWLHENIETDYFPYDQRHFNGLMCKDCIQFGCNTYLDSNRLTIQEELQKYTNYMQHYNPGHTVALHMLAFAVIMGFDEIYITGLDFEYRLGYANNDSGRTPPGDGYFDSYGSEILDDVQIITNSAQNIGRKIYNTNPNSKWKILQYKPIII